MDIDKSAQFTVHRYIPLIPLKRIHARNIPQNAVVAYHMRGCDVIPPVDREQHFFLHVFGVGSVIRTRYRNDATRQCRQNAGVHQGDTQCLKGTDIEFNPVTLVPLKGVQRCKG